MKIAILGAPGAGKTKIARRVVKELSDSGGWKIVDGYVSKLKKRTGLPFGEISNFSHNLTAITERWVLEAEALNKNQSTITCGTIYESIIYSTFQTLFIRAGEANLLNDQWTFQTMMQTLGILEAHGYDYDAMLWIPYSSTVAEGKADTWDAIVDAKIPEVLEAFGKQAIPLLGTDKEKVARTLEVIRVIKQTFAPTEDDQRTI